MNTIYFAHAGEDHSVPTETQNTTTQAPETVDNDSSPFSSGWVSVPLFVVVLICLVLFFKRFYSWNIVQLTMLTFVLSFVTGVFASTFSPILSIVAVSLGMGLALMFVLTVLTAKVR